MFRKITLKNGFRLILAPQKGTTTLTVLVLSGTGSKYEKKEISGGSHLLEHMLFKGTEKRPNKLDISEPLDAVGGIYNAFTGEEYTGYFAKVDSKHFDLALDIISDIYLNSKLEEKELEKEKGVVIEEINMYYDQPSSWVENLWDKLLYGDQPAGWGIIGTKETVSKISRKQLWDYMKSQYVSQNTVVCLAGNISEPAKAIAAVKRYFKNIENKKSFDKLKVKECQKKPDCLLQERKTDQTHFCLGVRTYDLFSPQKYVLEVLAAILGGMMSSRLFIKIREELGMAYYIHTVSNFFTDTGYLATQAGVDNNRVEKAISVVLKEYKKMAAEEISEKELRKAKDNLIGKMSLQLESSDSQAFFYGLQEILEKKIMTPRQIQEKINKVTSKDILKTAKEIFKPEKLNLALIGPFNKKEEFLKLLKI
jgi:predicted Zn-dependent peptidase